MNVQWAMNHCCVFLAYHHLLNIYTIKFRVRTGKYCRTNKHASGRELSRGGRSTRIAWMARSTLTWSQLVMYRAVWNTPPDGPECGTRVSRYGQRLWRWVIVVMQWCGVVWCGALCSTRRRIVTKRWLSIPLDMGAYQEEPRNRRSTLNASSVSPRRQLRSAIKIEFVTNATNDRWTTYRHHYHNDHDHHHEE